MNRWITAPFLLMLLLLAGSELIVRGFFARNMSGRFEYGYHPTAGFVENQDGTVSLVRAGGRRFFPQRFSRRRPAGTFRVLVVGDSVPRGPSVAASYPGRIAGKLQALGIQAESYNMGVAGNGARRSQIILRKALDYEPSVVVLHVNNSNEYEDEREFKRAQEFKSWSPKNWLMKSLLVHRLHEAKTEQMFWKWLPGEVRILGAPTDADAEVQASQNLAKIREWDERVRQHTAASVALARDRGVPILLVAQTRCRQDASGHYALDDMGLDRMLLPFIGKGVYFLSMKEVFQETDFAPLFGDQAHLRLAGHERMAEAVVNKLRQENLSRGG